MSDKSPLGEKSEYRGNYSPDLLHPMARDENRRILGITTELPFQGEDIWNAYELTWLNDKGNPQVATAEFRVPAESPNIVESKSMKLYLNSFWMTRYKEPGDLTTIITGDLTHAAGAPVSVRLIPLAESGDIGELPGNCIDELDAECVSEHVDPGMLKCLGDAEVLEVLHSHLLRSNCPVTNQPDSGSILIRYRGRSIDRESLFCYLVSYRNHKTFHESCVERIFLDIKARCEPAQLTVYARYNRRGGLDINPFRSNFEFAAPNLRLWRQ